MAPDSPSRPIVLVTGGSRGIGRGIALYLARHGADVIVTFNRQAQDASDVVEQARQAGARAAMLALDLSADRALDGFVDAFQAQLRQWRSDRFAHLVNNAGAHAPADFGEIEGGELDFLYRLHFKGPVLLSQAMAPHMSDGGRIVNISSSLTRHVAQGSLAYAAMKGALEIATRYMAQELGPRGIRVNAIAPGATATDFFGGAVRDNSTVNQYVSQHTALGRAALPDDIAPAVASLLKSDNHWITAQRIEVSGGMLL